MLHWSLQTVYSISLHLYLLLYVFCVISHLFSRFCIYTCYIGNRIQYTVFLFIICIYYFMYFVSFLVFFLDFVFTHATLVIAYSIQYFSSSSVFIILLILYVISRLFSRFCIYTCYIVIADSIQYFSSSSVFIILCVISSFF